MPEFYAEYNKRGILTSPDYNRTRHAYRSPRKSHAINLESEQFRYSVLKLYSKSEELNTTLISVGTLLTEGGALFVKYNSTVDPNQELEGLENLSARLLDAKRRINELERVL